MGRLLAASRDSYLSEETPGTYTLRRWADHNCGVTLTLADWVIVAHTILAEAEITQREKDGSL